ncbi:MAG: membrane dipeptidase [Bacteroidaceae bacterium]|nr:membrane dipeptidase [Bacteroidaceae bacterium]
MKAMFDCEAEYTRVHNYFPACASRPVIGITGNFSEGNCTVADGYVRSVLAAGGVPLIIPPYDNEEMLLNTLHRIDGLLLTGGGDINPLFWGEEPVRELGGINFRRDRQELLMVRLAANRQIPVLGICRGIQVMMAALGGVLYQDIYSQSPGCCIKHSQELERSCPSHTVSVEEGTLLNQIFSGEKKLFVNSFHHQAVKEPAPGFRVSASAVDGIIEAVESTEYKQMIGVQWHPECMILSGDESMLPLFEWLVDEAALYRKAREIHDCTLTIDSHCDTPMFFDQGVNFHTRDPKVLVDLHKMTEGGLDATVMVAYLKQLERDEASLKAATAKADRILDEIEALVEKNAAAVKIAYTPKDLYQNKRVGKKSILLGIENGYAVGKELSLVKHFACRGVTYMTLCHNGDNDICDSARGHNEHGGVSPFGEQVIREMNRLGMMVDLSHASEKSFYDALEISSEPVICSHSSVRALCDHPRNLTDDQLRALAAQGGVAQVCLYSGFLRQDAPATIADAMQHLQHMIDVMGIEHVGIGTDFDGDGGIIGCASASELINLTRQLLRKRYSEEDIARIWGGNFLRVMRKVQTGRY